MTEGVGCGCVCPAFRKVETWPATLQGDPIFSLKTDVPVTFIGLASSEIENLYPFPNFLTSSYLSNSPPQSLFHEFEFIFLNYKYFIELFIRVSGLYNVSTAFPPLVSTFFTNVPKFFLIHSACFLNKHIFKFGCCSLGLLLSLFLAL